ncbi:F-box/LRR-repeat protein 3-like [Lotus japonicus]|uniref:F-box/LRR-repeat protein 3-like n=1 Tax=Lotus japonicus TaxID=34305 RepID=UPI002582CA55|nr:F-box/LRR-repeat protein 3-like [Lotus japonicus]
MLADIHLPEECWECVFRFLNHHHYLESVSLVSKQFLSITNRIRSTLAIPDPTLPFLPRLLHRFPNLTSLDLTRFRGDLDALLLQISRYPLRRLTSLDVSHHPTFPANGLRGLAEKMKTLTSLTCSHMGSLSIADILLITDCSPFLQELDLSFPKEVVHRGNNLPLALPKLLRKVNLSGESFIINDEELIRVCKNCEFLEELDSRISDELLCSVAEEGLPLRKLVLDDCRNYTYAGISCLLSSCKFVQHLDLQSAEFLNDQHVAELSVFLGNLISIDISYCKGLTDLALFALIRNCSLLSEIKMKVTGIGKKKVQYSNSFMNCCVKSLHLGWNPYLGDESIKLLSLVCPNMQLLDLRCCSRISEGVVEVLRRFCTIRDLSIGQCLGVKLHGLNFKVPNVEVLNLAHSGIDDETLSVVAKSFCGLKYLDLEYCRSVTDKGVRKVVENCKQLREINLHGCYRVAGSVVAWMVFSRPTLRKIVAPRDFQSSARQSELFLRHGCRV